MLKKLITTVKQKNEVQAKQQNKMDELNQDNITSQALT